ncbi:hypothetical protein B0T14DRAFT_559112 [Immersiella caudata]|uniref:Uncharacterized protein n=1 Tax=Immersiella caudata TaxID=314043 RepID=A0AA40CBJ3_9PEZI|nr:hypothetical protein B0T14DRAFT_559112 [Immersiella caudata]
MQRKVWWLLLGLFTPELVAWTAYEQHREAKQLYVEVKALLGEELPKSKFKRFRIWLGQRLGGGKLKEGVTEKGPDDSAGAQRVDSELSGTIPNAHSVRDEEIQAISNTDLEAGPEPQVELEATPSVKPATSRDANTNTPFAATNLAKKSRNEWTMVHSYYAIMGGFAFDTRSIGDGREFLPGGRVRITLTSQGIIELLKVAPHLMPNVSVGEIRDKSKASWLAKAIVTLQASWFSAQCISRMVLGMTVSLLELNTLAHAVCALAAYLLWWHKPLDVDEPTLILGDDAHLVLAGICMQTRFGGHLPMVTSTPGRWKAWLAFQRRKSITAPLDANLHSFGSDTLSPGMASRGPALKMLEGETVHGFQWTSHYYSRINAVPTRLPHRSRSAKDWHDGIEDHVPLSAADVLRLSMAEQRYVNLDRADRTSPYNRAYRFASGQPWLHDRAQNLPVSTGRCVKSGATSILFSLFTAGLAYGGLHLLAWGPPVRTATEVLMWRASGIAIIAYGAMLMVLTWGIDLFKHTGYKVRTSTHPLLVWICSVSNKIEELVPEIVTAILILSVMAVVIAITISGTLAYTLARVYLVVECFISIGRLPASVLETPQWAKYLPHFS